MTSMRLSTPLRPTIWAPRMVPSAGSKMSLAAIRVRARVVGGVVEGVGVDRPVGASAACRRRSLHPTVAATRSNTFTMAVPSESTGCEGRPAMWSATRRPWRLATLAKAISEVAWEMASGFSTASPTA